MDDMEDCPANGMRVMMLIPALLESLSGYGEWRPPRDPDGMPMLNGTWSVLSLGTHARADVYWSSPAYGIGRAKLDVSFYGMDD